VVFLFLGGGRGGLGFSGGMGEGRGLWGSFGLGDLGCLGLWRGGMLSSFYLGRGGRGNYLLCFMRGSGRLVGVFFGFISTFYWPEEGGGTFFFFCPNGML
jgi:hypothetical protein